MSVVVATGFTDIVFVDIVDVTLRGNVEVDAGRVEVAEAERAPWPARR